MENQAQQQQQHKEEEKKQSRTRYDHLRQIERKIQEASTTMNLGQAAPLDGYDKLSFEEKNKGKYMVTFPYPYMNGFMHLGHAFSLSKCEFQARYQRQLGKNVIFPFSFHCTGMPIQAAANRLRREIEQGKTSRNCQCAHESAEKKCPCPPPPKDPKKDTKQQQQEKKCICVPPTQYEILASMGISAEEIPKFKDPLHWLMYFPPEAQNDLKDFGLYTDWRRSFITTNVNPYYDSFIRWQFNILKSKDKVKFGRRYTIYSEQDKQPCADHDRSKGEGVGPQEYTLIKLKVLELPQSVKDQFQGKNVFMVAATLRPETMYGQTNCYVLPEGEYGIFEMKNDEYFICSERSARNMAFQDLTKEDEKYSILAKVSGQDLIGIPLKAPLSKFDVVYALPMQTISMTKGTGIVTSVPSDAPDDWAALRDLQTKKGLREKYNVKEEWCMPFEPVPIIDIPEFGNLSAVKLVEDMKIQSQKDKDKLTEAKDKVYLKGFYEGVMLVGEGQGLKVQEAKPIVKKSMFDAGSACPYYEPENEIISRSGDQCVVALCDQWFLTYGEEEWKNFVKQHVKSENFSAYNPKNQTEFEETLDWLNAWACSRTSGLGTILPWDKNFVIESLSDSTIYMAYYTVSHMLQGGVMDGSKPGPIGIKPEELNDGVWDYIFRKGAYPEGCTIPEEKLQKLRYEFEYWYPMDLRCSGKDLIRNHLTMSLYNHAAIWEDQKMLPRGFFCNGWVMVNGEKMSKSKGNFRSIRDCINMYGVDATRMALADAGDGLDDANFDELVANSAILRLFVFERWLTEEIKKFVSAEGLDFSKQPNYDTWDNILDNEINNAIDHTTKSYNELKYKQALKHGFFELQNFKDDYLVAKKGNMNPFILMKFIETQLILINPICPHFAQYCWETHVLPIYEKSQNLHRAPTKLLLDQGWPHASKPYDGVLRRMYDYLKLVKSSIRVAQQKAHQGGKKPKQQKGAAAAETKSTENVALFVALEYPDWQKQTLEVLQGFEFNEENKIQGNFIQTIKAQITGPKQGLALKFAAHIAKEAEATGKDAALEIKTPFDEKELLETNKDFVFENMPTLKNITILKHDDPAEIENSKNARESALPGKPSTFFY